MIDQKLKDLIVSESHNFLRDKGIKLDDEKGALIDEYRKYLQRKIRRSSNSFGAIESDMFSKPEEKKEPAKKLSFDDPPKSLFEETHDNPIVLTADSTEFESAFFVDTNGEKLIYKIPDFSVGISGNRHHQFQLFSIEITTGQTAAHLIESSDKQNRAMRGRLMSATAGTNPITTGEILNYLDSDSQIKFALKKLIDPNQRTGFQTMTIFKACALAINLYDKNGKLHEDVTVYDDQQIKAKVKDFLRLGINTDFFLAFWIRGLEVSNKTWMRNIQEHSQ